MEGRKVHITAGDLIEANKYKHGSVRNIQHGVELAANLGNVYFDYIKIKGPVVALYGTNIISEGGVKSKEGIDLFGSLKSGGNVKAKLDLRIGGNLTAENVQAYNINVQGNAVVKQFTHSENDTNINAITTGSLYCGNNFTANNSFKAYKQAIIDGHIRVGSDLTSMGLQAKSLDVRRNLLISNNLDVEENADIGGDYRVYGVSTVGELNIGGDMYDSYIKRPKKINLAGEIKKR